MTQKKVVPEQQADKPGWKKVLWFVGLWLAGVLTLTIIGYGIRLFLS